jgi:hypothetical protein
VAIAVTFPPDGVAVKPPRAAAAMLRRVTGLLKVVGVVIATALCLALFTVYGDGPEGALDARTVVLGLPVVSVGQTGARGWIGIGQVASGVLVLGQGGFGLVTFAQGGVGLIFGIGQGMVGLMAIAQIGIGAFAFMGQVGLGAQAIGQGVFKSRGRAYFQELSAELTEVLSFRAPPATAVG